MSHDKNRAVQNGHSNVVHLLVGAGSDTSKKNKRGDTPLEIAPLGTPLDVMRVLQKRKTPARKAPSVLKRKRGDQPTLKQLPSKKRPRPCSEEMTGELVVKMKVRRHT
jgi:ankyrin repeat protein